MLAESDLREVVELVGVGRVARRTQLVGLRARSNRLAAPVLGRGNVFGEVLLEQTEVADGLGDGSFGLLNARGVVTHHLVEHLLGVFSGVEQSVNVRLGELSDAAEDGLL